MPPPGSNPLLKLAERLAQSYALSAAERDAILANAPQGGHGFFTVPKVVE